MPAATSWRARRGQSPPRRSRRATRPATSRRSDCRRFASSFNDTSASSAALARRNSDSGFGACRSKAALAASASAICAGVDLRLDQGDADPLGELGLRVATLGAAQIGDRFGRSIEGALAQGAAEPALGGDLRIAGAGELLEAGGGLLQPFVALRALGLEARRRLQVQPVAQVEELQRDLLAVLPLLALLQRLQVAVGVDHRLLVAVQPVLVPRPGVVDQAAQCRRRARAAAVCAQIGHRGVELVQQLLFSVRVPRPARQRRGVGPRRRDLLLQVAGRGGRGGEQEQRRGAQDETGKTTCESPSFRHWL